MTKKSGPAGIGFRQAKRPYALRLIMFRVIFLPAIVTAEVIVRLLGDERLLAFMA